MSADYQWLSVAYWRDLCNGAAITEAPDLSAASVSLPAASGSRSEEAESDWRALGYSRLSGIYDDANHRLFSLANAARKLEAAGWPATFIILCDDVWWLVARAQREIYGPNGLRCNGDFYAWTKTSGWSIHRDRDDVSCVDSISGSPAYTTLWVPLTDASPRNGNVYVVPKQYDPRYYGEPEEESEGICFADILALPARRGDALTWTGRALHFGGRPDEQVAREWKRKNKGDPYERIALSVAFSKPHFETSEEHGLDSSELTPGDGLDLVAPSISRRLELAVTQLMIYDSNSSLPTDNSSLTALVALCKETWQRDDFLQMVS